jgi:hypothetical protein
MQSQFDQLSQDAIQVSRFIQSANYRVLTLEQKQSFLNSQKAVITDYFAQLKTKVAAYQVRLNAVNSDYQDQVIELSRFEGLNANTNESLVSKSLRVSALYKKLNDYHESEYT